MWVLSVVKGIEYAADGLQREARILPGQDRFVIGRDPACDWHIPDATLAMSGRHCEIVRDPDGTLLRDLSTNGTFVNGSPRRMKAEHRLNDGDRITVGPFTVLVIAADDITVANPATRGADPAAALAAADAEDSPLTRIAPAPAKEPPAAPKVPPAAPRSPGVADTLVDLPAGVLHTIADPLAPTPPPLLPVVDEEVSPGAEALMAQVLARLAAGLGVSPSALAGRSGVDSLKPADVVALAERAGALARTGLLACQRMGEQQSRARRKLGSRAQAAVRADVAHALRVAATPEQALLALMRAPVQTGAAALQQAYVDLEQHYEQLLAALGTALHRLAQNIEPAALERAIDRGESATLMQSARKAALWDLYARVWQTTGLASGQEWVASFVEAGWLHLGAAYDEAAREVSREAPRPPG